MPLRRVAAGRPSAANLAFALAVGLFASALAGCGTSERRPADDEPPAPVVAEIPAPTPLPLGKASLADFAYSRGPAREVFRRVAAAERTNDWLAAVAACRETLALDPGHLEASWSLAINLARLGRHAEVLDPLSAAVAGDTMRWGERSLIAQALTAFHATPHGARWAGLQATYRETFRGAVSRGLLVVGRRGKPWYPRGDGAQQLNHRSEIYVYDVGASRFSRLSRTNGSAAGFLRSPDGRTLAVVSYRKVWLGGAGAHIGELRVGVVDLERVAISRREVTLADVVSMELSFVEPAGALQALVVQAEPDGTPRAPIVFRLDVDSGQARPVSELAPSGAVLRVEYDLVRTLRAPVAGVIADWDAAGAAGAFRLEATRKTISLPADQAASSHSMVWSPARASLAFATVAAEPCSAQAAERAVILYVVDAATGGRRELARGEGDLAPMWLDEARLAYIDNTGATASVRLLDVATGIEHAHIRSDGGVSTDRLVSTQACRLPALDVDERAFSLELDDDSDRDGDEKGSR